MAPNPTMHGEGLSTRDRILRAATVRFSRQSYESVGLRDIGADAGVDVSYVHRCFGSKERLFAKALKATTESSRYLVDAEDGLIDTLAKQVFARDKKHRRNAIGPFDIIIRSLSSPDAARVLREFILDDFINPLAERLDQDDATRAAIIAALLAGIGILRNVLGVSPLQQPEGGEVERLIARTIASLLTADSSLSSYESSQPERISDEYDDRRRSSGSRGASVSGG